MQGFFKCPVDNLHAEPLIARWIRQNVPDWKEAVVVSKNAGGTKRVTSLADALKLNFGMVTTDKKRGNGNMTGSMILNPIDAVLDPIGESVMEAVEHEETSTSEITQPVAGAASPARRPNGSSLHSAKSLPSRLRSSTSALDGVDEEGEGEYNDQRVHEVTQARLVHGHIVPDDFESPAVSTATSVAGDDPMTMSYASLHSQHHAALGGSGDAAESSDEDEEILKDPKVEHMVTLVGDVKNRTVFIVDDMIDKPGSWIAAAETVVKRGLAKKVYCIATHAVFGADCLEQLQECDSIHHILVTNSYPIPEEKARNASKLHVLDLSYLLAEAIRRNHYGESISPLFQHIME